MNRNASFIRKIGYIIAIALLLLPLSALSRPATVSPAGSRTRSEPGGKLAQLRAEYNLAQAELGEIDPASEAMKLSTLGLRGVAANILWAQANHYKKVEDWDKVEVAVNQIIRLQPNFLNVWDFQAHNLSYNISTEFDDYRMRYQWVKKGIEFLILGTHYNREEPGLLNQIGWFMGQKVGRSDEQKEFRRIFRDDKDFHETFRRNGIEVDQQQALGPDAKPDNWLVARLWYNAATDAVTFSGKPIRGKAPLLFYSGAPMSQINGASAMQADGFFFERAQIAWQTAAREWTSYGNRELPTTAGYNIRLNEEEAMEQKVEELFAELDKLAPGIREELRKEKIATLTPEQQAAVKKPKDDRTPEERIYADEAEMTARVTAREVADQAPRELRPKLRTIVEQIESYQDIANRIHRDRAIVNFVYWRTRCEAEMSELAQSARASVYEADHMPQGEDFEKARRLYEEGFDRWAQLFDKYPILMENAEAQDLIDSVERYRDLLGQLEEPFPVDFKLNRMLDLHDKGRRLKEQILLLQGEPSSTPKPADTTPKPEPPKSEQPLSPTPETSSPKADDAKAKNADEERLEEKAADKKPAEEKADDKKADEAKTDDDER